jgi:acyl-CoA synthetase (AMP-forming)/AMP-acid ligase II
MNLFALLDATARRYPDQGALYHGERQAASYRELHDTALRCAAALRSEIGGDGRIAIAAANCTEYIELIFASWAAGLAIVPINAKLHPQEMAAIIEDAEPALIFASAEVSRELRPLLGPRPLVEIGSSRHREMRDFAPGEPAETAPDALAWLFYTSGTTGRPKGAMLSHRNLLAMTLCYLADVDRIERDHSIVHAAPLSHGSGLYALPFVARGARHVIPLSGGYDPAEFIDLCDAHPQCSAFLAPTMVRRLRLEAEAQPSRKVQTRSIVYGGGPMYLDEIRASLARLGPIFVQIYGQGESPMTITALRREDHGEDDPARLGSVGWARTGVEVRVVGADGRSLPPGEIGEIVCRGDVVMEGYWCNPAATAETLRNGWLHTGDVGALDGSGRLTLHDRSKDVIISGGSNIYPREVEEALLTHPAVAEVSVVGEPDAEWGENVVAVVVLELGAEAEARALDDHCLARIARFKRPKRYVFATSLPKNSYGKVLKRDLQPLLATLPLPHD